MSKIIKGIEKQCVLQQKSAKTLLERAKREVPGFVDHFKKFEEQTVINGYSSSTIFNYSRAVAKLSLYFKKSILDLGPDEVNVFLYELAKERWIQAREAELLSVPYFHIIFTLPHELNPLALRYPKEVYNALFTASWQTFQEFGNDHKHLGAKSGMTSILHTWGQNLSLHPDLHCIVPYGGLKKDKWVLPKKASKKRKSNYLYPQKALAKVFRAKYVQELRKHIEIPQDIARKIFKKDWVVYAKQPFLGPKQVIEYLGRYTHKIAISNHRITSIDNQKFAFKYKDYRTAKSNLTMQLDAVEFIRRFALHILPKGFVRIRHYGILASRNKKIELNIAKKHFNLNTWTPEKISWKLIAEKLLNKHPLQCKKCKKNTLKIVAEIPPERGPPKTKNTLTPNLNFSSCAF